MRGPVAATLLGVACATAAGCWYPVDKYCEGCAVVDHELTWVPTPEAGTRTEVVLVHGTLGFGGEWREVVGAVRQSPGFDLVAWSWPGPFHDPQRDALALGAELQALLDFLPPSVDELIVLAHSAGADITNLAIRQLRVPAGRHVTVALLDPPAWPPVGRRDLYAPLPSGVSATVYYAKRPPTRTQPTIPSAADGTDLPRQYVGAIGHDPIVARVSLPILGARRQITAPHACTSSPRNSHWPPS